MTESWSFEDCCGAAAHTDFNGVTTDYAYDLMKRETKRTYPDGSWIERQYNTRGQTALVKYSSQFGFGNRAFTYDNVTGRLLQDAKEDGQNINYKYDLAGNLIETAFTGGHVTTYKYDKLNRLSSVTNGSETTTYTYDNIGNRATMTYPNGATASYEYDQLSRLTYLENKGPNGIISSYRYTLGAAGNRLKIIENSGAVNDYQYDRLYRLKRESRTGDNAYWISYNYDAFGNRAEMNTNGQITTYAYDKNDRLINEISPNGTTTYSWDNNGNMIGKTAPDEAWVYNWNYDNKLKRADLNGQLSAEYSYDFQGERIYKNALSGATHFLVDNNNLTGYSQSLRETDAVNAEIVSYTYGDDLISQKRAAPSYYHYDGLGSTRAITSAQGNISDTFVYQAFGTILARTGTTEIANLFTGEAYDFNLGYYYLRARLCFASAENGVFRC